MAGGDSRWSTGNGVFRLTALGRGLTANGRNVGTFRAVSFTGDNGENKLMDVMWLNISRLHRRVAGSGFGP